MNIGPDTFEKAIHASCIQLAQAYAITKRITIEEAKAEVGKYIKSLKDFNIEEEVYDPTPHFKEAVTLALKVADGKPEKAYLELLKLRESLS